MQSLTYDRALQSHAAQATRDLLVLWQHPIDRSIAVVGRLQYDGATYIFGYTRSSASLEGFRGLPGLRDFGRLYESDQLFPVFAQRTMDPSRPDYSGYLSSLGLVGSTATPLEQIIHSGGRRAADTIQLMEVPQTSQGRLRGTFLVNGVRHIPQQELGLAPTKRIVSGTEHESALRRLVSGDRLRLLPEPYNTVNNAAILLASPDGIPLGWVPNALVGGVQKLIQAGEPEVKVLRANGPDAPPHLRIIVDLEASSFGGSPFEEDDWKFIGTKSAHAKD